MSYSTLLSPPVRPSTATGSSYTPSQSTFTQSTLSPSTFTTTQTGTGTGTGAGATGSSETQTQTTPTSTLRRPTRQEGSPRSPLTNVRNIVALWKERTPTRNDGAKVAEVVPPTSVSPTPEPRTQREGERVSVEDDGGLFGLRRRASGKRASAESVGEGESERVSSGSNGLDVSELSRFLGGNGTETVRLCLFNFHFLTLPFSRSILVHCTTSMYTRNLLIDGSDAKLCSIVTPSYCRGWLLVRLLHPVRPPAGLR
ncbi:hypothetical protein BDP27DRAFT_17836 [Rhodocollybia butyracea]|uniref:Uncharacterized protein n=1 Tax=Rhodocollybia butyracea TaxID=206335 RepID=A0A9P5QBS6_9AGAR|nr:hypothetical protein BDP27DRAFT_17836 [Rhodocollybia butyracea]